MQNNNSKIKKFKVFVAMSGGVDSSVAAALLKKQGFDVIGIFMKFWTPPENYFGEKCYAENKCCSGEAERISRQVADKLKIPFYVMDFRNEFKKAVVDYFLKEYNRGRTPNPCVVCNQKIKFDLLFKKVLSLGGDYLATGHYIKKRKAKSVKRKTIYQLFQAKDNKKDQSYFLWTLTQTQLKHLLFPIGDYTKDKVKKIAVDLNLPVCQRESFDICFTPPPSQGGHNAFLKKYLKLKPGLIVTKEGEKVDEHQGLPLYTIGQRAGIGIGGIGPFYVVGCDYKNNRLIVTNDSNDPKLFRKELVAEKVNWIRGTELILKKVEPRHSAGRNPAPKNFWCGTKIRYGHKAEAAEIKKLRGGKYKVIFRKPQRAITPGQSVVFYKRKELLGGGVIRG